MTKQHSMLFQLVMTVLLINNIALNVKSVEFEYVTTYFSMPRGGGVCYIWREYGNYIFSHSDL